MARYRISGEIDGSNIKVITKRAGEVFGDGVRVEKVERNVSRSSRLSAAESDFDTAKSEVEALRDEMQEWYDNMPENFQNGTKGEEVQAAVDALEEIVSNMEGCDFSGVDFPGMY